MAQIKTKAIVYQGINTNNSDYAAVDGELEVSQNVISEDGGLKVIMEPQDTGFTPQEKGEEVVFIHKNAGYEHWITIAQSAQSEEQTAEPTATAEPTEESEESDTTAEASAPTLGYYDMAEEKDKDGKNVRHEIAARLDGEYVQCSAIGNVLMVLTSEHLYYFLFNQTNQAGGNESRPYTGDDDTSDSATGDDDTGDGGTGDDTGDGGQYIALGTSLPELDISFTTLGYFRSDGDLYQSKEDCVVVDSGKVAAATSEQADSTNQSDSAIQTDQTNQTEQTEQAKSALRAVLPVRPLAMEMESLAYSISKYFGDDWPSEDNEIAEVKADETDNAGKNYPQLFTDVCFNALNNLILEARQQGLMVMPRLARAAWRMYDGTYAKMTTPVLLFNTGTRHMLALHGTTKETEGGPQKQCISSTLLPYSVDFLIRNDMDAIREQWKDIIKGVTIFLGSEVYDYDQNGLVESLRHTYSDTTQQTSLDINNEPVSYKAGTEGYYAVLPRIGEGEQLKQVKAGAPFFRAYDMDIEDVMSGKGTPTESAGGSDTAASTNARAQYTLLHFSRPENGTSISEKIKKHTVRLRFAEMGEDTSGQQVEIPIYDGDSMENIYQSVREAVEGLNKPVEVHKMYLTHRRLNNKKKLIDFSLGIAIVGKRGPVVLEEITTAEATETAATTTTTEADTETTAATTTTTEAGTETTAATTTTAEPEAEAEGADATTSDGRAEATATAEPAAAAGAYTLNVTGINAYGHPLPSDELPLASLETQTSVQDDYMQHVEILPKYVRAYNSRLCMANLNIRHSAYTLSHLIVPRVAAYRIKYVMYYLRTSEGEAVIRTAYPNKKSLWDTCLHYLYYPDSRCYKAVVAAADSQGEVKRYLSFDMEASSGLNGAVFCDKMPYNDEVVMSDEEGKYYYDLRAHFATEMNGHVVSDESGGRADMKSAPTLNGTEKTNDTEGEVNAFVEQQKNVVLSTYVQNPWNWSASGVSEIGSSSVVALCPNTMAIEQEQFGKNPLYAFTEDEGVWGLSVGTDGQLVAAQPATRDILIDPDSLLQIDGAILFATRRGVMMLTGRSCTLLTQALESDEASTSSSVSSLPGWDQIMTKTGMTDKLPTAGEDIKDFVWGCRMAYDYLNSRIIIYRNDKAYAYVYSLKSKQWGMMVSGGLCRSLNSYPEALCATTSGTIVSLSNRTGGYKDTPLQGFALSWGPRKTRPYESGNDDLRFLRNARADNTAFGLIRPYRATITRADMKTPQNQIDFGGPVKSAPTEEIRGLSEYPQADQAQSASVASDGGIKVTGVVVTRPLKVSDYDVLKTVYEVFQRGKIRPGHVWQAVWGSRDLWHWNLLGSSKREFLTGMAGSPYTYFRVALWGQMETDEIIHRMTLSYRDKYLGRQRAANNANNE